RARRARRGEPRAGTLVSLEATVSLCPISLCPKIRQLLKRLPQHGRPPPPRLPPRRRSRHWSEQISSLIGRGASVRASAAPPVRAGGPLIATNERFSKTTRQAALGT